MKNILILLTLLTSFSSFSVPYEFEEGEVILATEINANFISNSNTKACPATMVAVEGVHQRLGCISEVVYSPDTWLNAASLCWDTFNSRIPSIAETSAFRFAAPVGATLPTNDFEWSSNYGGTGIDRAVIDDNSISHASGNSSYRFRCWVDR